MLEIRNTATEMKNVFDRHFSSLVIVKERISELEHISLETSKSEFQREKRLEKIKNKKIRTE